MSKQPQSLPVPMVLLAYIAAGGAMSCSWLMLRQVLDQQAAGLTGGALIGLLLPTSILFGAAVLARMAGHLSVRGIGFGLVLVGCSWVYLEGISIYTSYISVNVTMETRQQAEKNSTATAIASNQSQASLSRAIASLTTNMENMPDNWITKRERAGEQLAGLVEQQNRLAENAQNQTTAISRTLTDEKQRQWAMAIAIALSIIVLGVQFGLGATSDGSQRERRHVPGFFDELMGAGSSQETVSAKKTRGLEVVK